MSRKEQKVFQDANDAGINHGFTLPMHHTLGALGIMSLTFEGSEPEYERFYHSRAEAAQIFAYSFNEAIINKHASHFGKPHTPKLTPKEIEVIKWLAAGSTYDQTADKMTVGVSTIRKHTTNAIHKLKAKNGTHACALALRWGLIY